MSGREPGPNGAVAPAISVRVRGELVVMVGTAAVLLRPKERTVLAAIALAHPQPIGIERIVSLVWPDDVPATARKTVQNHIARIRRTVDDLVETTELGYRFTSGVVLDRHHVGSVDVPLADLPDTPEIDAHRQRIAAHVVAADEQRWETALSTGPTPELVAELHAGTRAEPYRERRWRLLATAHAELGARRAALQTCHAARTHLAEIGLVPGEELRDLERRLLQDEPAGQDDRSLPVSRPIVHPHRQEPFVGRSLELARLGDAWRRTVDAGSAQLVVVQGPAGCGKTRLLDEFCRTLPDDTTVLVARHRPDGEQALAPLTAAIRPVADVLDDGTLAPGRVLAAVRSALRHLAERPHVLILDDAHWASDDAIAVVRDALDATPTPTLLLLTTRPTDPGSETWTSLGAVATMHHVTVGELTRDEVAELVEAAELDEPPDIDLVYARTTGLPYYASELLRVARLTGRLEALDVPSVIRTWMQRRLTTIGEVDAELVRAAAIAGPVVDPDLLAQVTGQATDAVVAGCDRLVAVGLLTADQGSGTLRFNHELSRDAITGSLGPAKRAALHRRIADAIAGIAPPALVAHHLVRAGPTVAGRAAAACTEAGMCDLSTGAWRQAESWFRSTLAVASDDATRAQALSGLGRALVGQERFDESEAALRAAIDLARQHGLDEVHAAATLALAGRAGRGAGVATSDGEIAALLRSALDRLERTPEPDRDRLLLMSAVERELAIVLLLGDAPEERNALLDRQLARARRLDPPEPAELASALLASRYAKLDGPSLTGRLRDLDEVLSLPADQVGAERLLTAQCYRHEDLVRAGDRARAGAALTDAEGLVRRYPHPYWNWVTVTWRAIEQIDAGRLEAAEQLAFEAAALRSGIDEAVACLGVNLVNLRLYQGRADEMLAPLADAIVRHPHIPTYRAVLALCSAEAGDTAAARRHLRHFTDADLRNVPDDTNRLLALAVLGHTAAMLDERDAAPLLRAALAPFSGQWVVLNCYGGGGAVWGPVDHAIGRLAALEGDDVAAVEAFGRAEQQSSGAPLVLERIAADRTQAVGADTRRRRPEDRAAS